MRLTFSVEGIPQGKGRARSRIVSPKAGAAFVSHYTPQKTRDYEEGIAWAARAAMRGRDPLDEAVRLGLVVRCPVPASWSRKKQQEALSGVRYPTGRPDLDNIEKLACDALNGIVWRDDALVCEVAMIKRYSERPGIDVTVETLAAEDRSGIAGALSGLETPPPADPYKDDDARALQEQIKREEAECQADTSSRLF